MNQNKKGIAMGGDIASALAVSVLASMATTIILTGILAFMINSERITENAIGYGGMGILLAASFAGAIVAEKEANGNPLLASLFSGGIYFLVLIGITALFFEGSYKGVWVNALMILGGCGLAVILGKPSRRRGKGSTLRKRSSKVVQKRYAGK